MIDRVCFFNAAAMDALADRVSLGSPLSATSIPHGSLQDRGISALYRPHGLGPQYLHIVHTYGFAAYPIDSRM